MEETEQKFCCPLKQYYSQGENIFNTLEITPRVILCKKSFKLRTPYQQLITVKNIGTQPRSIKCNSDSPTDVELLVYSLKSSQYLMPGSSYNILVTVKPMKKVGLKRTRTVFLECEHPNIKIEVPIVVVENLSVILFPPVIEFPSSAAKTFAYYEFIVYNASANKSALKIRTSDSSTKIVAAPSKILRNDFVRVKLKLFVKNSNPYQGTMKIRHGNTLDNINFSHKPSKILLYMSLKDISFGETKFNTEVKKTFTICNESKVAIPYTFAFDENLPHLVPSHDLMNVSSHITLHNSLLALDTADESTTKLDIHDTTSFKINPANGELAPNSSTNFEVAFNALFRNFELSELTQPPFKMSSEVVMSSTVDEIRGNEYVVLQGLITGPNLSVSPKAIDFRNIYMGEECCDRIKVTNNDSDLTCKVKFFDYTNAEMAKIHIDPLDGYTLKPGDTGVFQFIFFGIGIGRIYTKLRLSIQNGGCATVVIRATSIPVQVKTHPPVVGFGNVPFGVPQKRSVLLVNPLSTPLSVQLFLKDSGSEVPLVLKIDDVRELPPITIQNPSKMFVDSLNDDDISCYGWIADAEEIELEDENRSLSYNSIRQSDEVTICSEGFDKEVMALVPKLAFNLLNEIKNKRVVEKNEAETRIVSEAANQLLKLSYFREFTTHNNYGLMDWNYMPSDPVEIYFDTEVIHLRPNAGHSVTVLIIPNNVGCFNRSIDVRCCPHSLLCSNDSEEHRMIVDSELMTTQLGVSYTCDIPKLDFQSEIVMDDRKIYAGQMYDFDMEFVNVSTTSGFFHFAIVPDCDGGAMGFRNGVFKFFISSEKRKVAQCEVEYKKLGIIRLTGMIKIIGSLLPLPFHVTARVLPPEVSIYPASLTKRQIVLEKRIYYFYIDNITPTITKVRFYLRDESVLIINPRGAQLAQGQGLYVALTVNYSDPDVYKNILYVDMLHGPPTKVPLTFTIDEVPIFFYPELRKNLEIGPVLMTDEFDYRACNEMFSKAVQVWNRGQRPYSITFTKLKSKKTTSGFCEAEIIKAQISIAPKSLQIEPGDKLQILITAVACQKIVLHNEFCCTIVDVTNPMRFTSFRFSVTVVFTGAQVKWSRKEVCMKFDRTHIFDQKQQIEMVKLVNAIEAPIKNVLLKVYGPFLIRKVYEKPFSREISLCLEPSEQTEIWITLTEKKLRDTAQTFMKGKIFCYANFKLQKCLPLRVDIKYPDIIITQPDLVVFTSDNEDHVEIQLENVGLLDANYTWKKLGECKNYIADFDDYSGLAYEILSDIFKMFDLHDSDERNDDEICQENLSFCYQKYRCVLATMEDPDRITDIVYEIIDNLDLEHKRHKIELSSDVNISEEETVEHQPEMIVRKTFDEVLSKLKLEDNYEMTEGSQDECFNEQHIYFLEKCGRVPGNEGARSVMHLPRVRKGYEHVACFILDVFGGPQQKLLVTAVNLPRVVEVCPKSIYLGVKPWYECYKVNFKAINATQFKVNIRVKDVPIPNVGKPARHYLINGFACIMGSRIFSINPYSSHRIRSQGIMGFSSEFIREFTLTVNDRVPTKFSLRGQGVMPILLAVHNYLPRTKQGIHIIKKEYELLRRIYYFSIFKDITYQEEELEKVMEEEEEEATKKSVKDISLSKISILSVSDVSDETDSELTDRVNRNWELLLSTYVVVYNNESVPHASLLEQLLATERFIDIMHENSHKRKLLQYIYREHCKSQERMDISIPVNLKYFTVQPIPFEQWGYVIQMKNLKLGQFRKYDIDLQFFGPGRLTACARTAIRIPGLYVHFEIRAKCGQEFTTYRAEEKMPDFFSKRYRNMFEREVDAEGDIRLFHAHSFDCEERCKFHKRDMTTKNRAEVRNYYNSLTKSANVDFKHHHINCTIYSSGQENASGSILRVNILIKLDANYYKEGQTFEDYLYIDLHMGPTLPILLRGLIK